MCLNRLPIIIVFFFPFLSNAQIRRNQFVIETGAEYMYSTHRTSFTGGSFELNRDINKSFTIGAGTEYSTCKFHADNGWNLYNLRITPLFLSQYFNFIEKQGMGLYLHLREGVALIRYRKEYQDASAPTTNIQESGFYGDVSLGGKLFLGKKINLFLETGLKSYHISTYTLEVNPHGVNFRMGLAFHIFKKHLSNQN